MLKCCNRYTAYNVLQKSALKNTHIYQLEDLISSGTTTKLWLRRWVRSALMSMLTTLEKMQR